MATSPPASARSVRRRRGPARSLLMALLLAMALVAAACGGDGGSDEGSDGGGGSDGTAAADAKECPLDALDSATAPVEVTVWHAYAGLTKTTLEELAAKFNAGQTKVKVSVEAQGTYEELLKKYEDALGDPTTLPDVILTEDTTTQFMIDSGGVVPAAACVAADPDAKATYDDVLPAVTAAYTVDGTLWPAAFSVSTPILYANNAILTAAGVDTSKYPETLDEVRATAEKIKAANVPGVDAPLVMKIDSWYIEHWLTGVDKPVVNENNGRDGLATKSELAQPTTTELFEWLKGMVDDGLLKGIPSSSSGIDEYLAINNKTSAMLIQTSTAITTVNALAGGLRQARGHRRRGPGLHRPGHRRRPGARAQGGRPGPDRRLRLVPGQAGRRRRPGRVVVVPEVLPGDPEPGGVDPEGVVPAGAQVRGGGPDPADGVHHHHQG